MTFFFVSSFDVFLNFTAYIRAETEVSRDQEILGSTRPFTVPWFSLNVVSFLIKRNPSVCILEKPSLREQCSQDFQEGISALTLH